MTRFTLRPLPTSLIPERLPLSGKVAIASRNAEEEGIVLLKLGWALQGRDVPRLLRWSMHLAQDLIGEGLLDDEEVDLAAGGFDALGLSLGELFDVTPCRVLQCCVSSIFIRAKVLSERTKTIAILGAMMSRYCTCDPAGSLALELRFRWI